MIWLKYTWKLVSNSQSITKSWVHPMSAFYVSVIGITQWQICWQRICQRVSLWQENTWCPVHRSWIFVKWITNQEITRKWLNFCVIPCPINPKVNLCGNPQELVFQRWNTPSLERASVAKLSDNLFASRMNPFAPLKSLCLLSEIESVHFKNIKTPRTRMPFLER